MPYRRNIFELFGDIGREHARLAVIGGGALCRLCAEPSRGARRVKERAALRRDAEDRARQSVAAAALGLRGRAVDDERASFPVGDEGRRAFEHHRAAMRARELLGKRDRTCEHFAYAPSRQPRKLPGVRRDQHVRRSRVENGHVPGERVEPVRVDDGLDVLCKNVFENFEIFPAVRAHAHADRDRFDSRQRVVQSRLVKRERAAKVGHRRQGALDDVGRDRRKYRPRHTQRAQPRARAQRRLAHRRKFDRADVLFTAADDRALAVTALVGVVFALGEKGYDVLCAPNTVLFADDRDADILGDDLARKVLAVVQKMPRLERLHRDGDVCFDRFDRDAVRAVQTARDVRGDDEAARGVEPVDDLGIDALGLAVPNRQSSAVSKR